MKPSTLIGVMLVAGGVACGTADPDALDPLHPAGADDAIVGVRLDPPSASTVVVLGETPAPLKFRAFITRASGIETEVTDRATWSTDAAAVASAAPGGALTLAGIGGHAAVAATVDGLTSSAIVVVRLTGEIFENGTTAASRARFDAPLDPAPVMIEYPLDGVVIPQNLPPFEIQWANDDAPLHRIHATSSDVLDVTFYTVKSSYFVPFTAWSKLGASSPDAPISLTVESVDAASRHHASAPRTMIATAEKIDQGIIFTHTNAGGIRAIDMLNATELVPATTGAQSQSCGGCHIMSRNGRRMSYAQNDMGLSLGAARYDDKSRTFIEMISPSALLYSPSATFNPAEDTTRPSMLATVAKPAPAINSTLALFDPDTGLPLPSDVSTMLSTLPSWIGTGATEPTWSMAGDRVVFSAYETMDPSDPRPGVHALHASIVESDVSFANGVFHFGPPSVLVQGTATESNGRPSMSVDGSAIAYIRALRAGPTPVEASAILRRSDRHVFPIADGQNEPGAWDVRTPDWGPAGSRYAWIVISTSRAYGHQFAAGKGAQLWVMAVDRAKLASGEIDPMSPPFWVPGQNTAMMYRHPQWPIEAPPIPLTP